MRRSILIATLLVSFSFSTKAQNLRIDFTNGDAEVFPISDVVSIKAELDTIQLLLDDGSLYTWGGNAIRKMNHETVVTNVDATVKENALRVFPNPSTGMVAISVDVSELSSSATTLEVFDLSGQLVKQIPFQANTGNSSIVWDGTDQTNNAVPSSTYLCVINDKENRFTQKVVIQK